MQVHISVDEAGANTAGVSADAASAPAPFWQRLVNWQRHSGRHHLPWQRTRDPYHVWLSEIMLQQTQVATVLGYYERFLAAFPTVQALAQASEDDVLALWSGLGYYSRARNLHRCAQQICSVYAGHFPRTAAALEQLPGIGPSTAAAIAAFCFGERISIFDANVQRVLARHSGFAHDLAQAAHRHTLQAMAQAYLPVVPVSSTWMYGAGATTARGQTVVQAVSCTVERPVGDMDIVAETTTTAPAGRNTYSADHAAVHQSALARTGDMRHTASADHLPTQTNGIADATCLSMDAAMRAYTQGLMDLGASLCTARQTQCSICPVSHDCRAYTNGNPLQYPVKTRVIRREVRTCWVLVLQAGRSVWLHKRPNSGIWAGLYAPPLLAHTPAAQCLPDQPDFPTWLAAQLPWAHIWQPPAFKHVLTHRDLLLHPICVQLGTGRHTASPAMQAVAADISGAWGTSDTLGAPVHGLDALHSPSAPADLPAQIAHHAGQWTQDWATLGLPAPVRQRLPDWLQIPCSYDRHR